MLRVVTGPLALVLLLAAAAPAAAAPASVDIVDYDFKPGEVRVAPGETVTWRFVGGDDHNVMSDPGQADSFRSGNPRAGGPNYVRRFDKLGSFGYFCELHPGMRGTVRVAVPDTTAPRVTSLRVRRTRVTRLRFRLSEKATVKGSIATRSRPGRRLRRFSSRLRSGERSIRLPVRGLREGRYVVRLQARDEARNPSATKTAGLRIR